MITKTDYTILNNIDNIDDIFICIFILKSMYGDNFKIRDYTLKPIVVDAIYMYKKN